jgi:hypothetical protein
VGGTVHRAGRLAPTQWSGTVHRAARLHRGSGSALCREPGRTQKELRGLELLDDGVWLLRRQKDETHEWVSR